ncbi:toxin-antitoxin system HicB family antitoxin [Shigella sonnei]|nr:toxin-antitoxin system HicB family antitoxin [Shigella sonnei]
MKHLKYKGYLGTVEPDAPFKGVFNVRLDPELGTGKRSH